MYKKRKAYADTGQCQHGRPERYADDRLQGHARCVDGHRHVDQRAHHKDGRSNAAHEATVEPHVQVLVDGRDVQVEVDGHEQPQDEGKGDRNAVDALEHGGATVEQFAGIACDNGQLKRTFKIHNL